MGNPGREDSVRANDYAMQLASFVFFFVFFFLFFFLFFLFFSFNRCGLSHLEQAICKVL